MQQTTERIKAVRKPVAVLSLLLSLAVFAGGDAAAEAIPGFSYPGGMRTKLRHPREFVAEIPGKDAAVYEFAHEGEEDWTAWGTTGPNAKGNYVVRVTIPESGATATCPFGVWDRICDLFTDQMEITVSGYGQGSSSLEGFPVPVYLREPSEDGADAYSGFDYARAGATGREMRFFDADGNPVEHEVETWNVGGTSVVWVRVPRLTGTATKLTLGWRRTGVIRVPDYDGTAVWRAYAGVWHMANLVDARIPDASGHGRDAYFAPGAEWEIETGQGPVGKSVYLKSGRLFVENDLFPANTTSNRLTYAGWYENPGFKNDGKMDCGYAIFAGLKYDAPSRDAAQSRPGFSFRMNNSATSVQYDQTGSGLARTTVNLSTGWGLIGGVAGQTANRTGMKFFRSTSATALTIDTSADDAVFVNGSDRPLQLATAGFRVDEVRVSTNAFSDAWLKEEHNAVVKGASYCTYGLVRRDCDRYNDGQGLVCDWWTTTPALSKTMWKTGESAATVTRGVFKSGATFAYEYLNPATGESYGTKQPKTAGAYRVVFDHAESVRSQYRDMGSAVDFYIYEAGSAITDIGGNGGDSGRILLMNADTNEKGPVANQGWCATDPEGVTRWEHLNDEPGFDNVLSGTESILYRTSDGAALWHLVDCRHGNTFAPGTTRTQDLMSDQAYLPRSQSTRAKSILDESQAATYDTTGWVLMRNVEGAAVYSPCYSNGVGTIYFDAVNSRLATNGREDVFALAVEVVRGDDASREPTGDGLPWERLTLCPSQFKATTTPVDDPETQELKLQVTTGKVTTRFYRVHVPVGEYGPVRFRIVRTAHDAAAGLDDSFILLDNVIASFPAARAELRPYGQFDDSTDGKTAVGYAGAFGPSLPAYADAASLTGRCTVVFKASGGEQPTVDQLSFAQICYRWRYLNAVQEPASGWKVASLVKAGENALTTVGPLPGVPCKPGDLEFYFTATMKGDFYQFVDYTGSYSKISNAGYTEEVGVAESRRQEQTALPSGGTDWYVRLRDGASDYVGVRLLTRETEDGPVATNRLELTGDRLWTARLRTAHALRDGLGYRLEAVGSSRRWCAAGDAEALPATLDLADDTTWHTVVCDAKTDYLVFQLDERRDRLQIAHGEFQDFSHWASAVNPEGLFVGNAADTNSVSVRAGEYDVTNSWAKWAASVATNKAWREDFKVDDSQVAAVIYPRNQPFAAATSRGDKYLAENAQWTFGKWSLQNNADPAMSFGDDSAVQLMGCGVGSLTFAGSELPDGLDQVRYTARVAQVNDFNDFTYYNGYNLAIDPAAPMGYRVDPALLMKNTTVVTYAALTETGATSYDGDGSISLVNYYHPQYGCYELKVSRGTSAEDLRLTLCRWSPKAGAIACEQLGTAILHQRSSSDEPGSAAMIREAKTPLTGFFLSAMEKDGKTLVTGGISYEPLSTEMGTAGFDAAKFACVTYLDSSASRLTFGSFGMLACNCPGVFVKPACYRQGMGIVSPSKDNVLEKKADINVDFAISSQIPAEDLKQQANWIVKTGRSVPLKNHSGYWGYQAADVQPQQVVVQLRPSGSATWQDVCTNTVSGFTDRVFENNVRDQRASVVRLRPLGALSDVRTDVVVNEVELTQWNGQWTPHYKDDTAVSTGFVYTAAWVADDIAGSRAVRLQPTRASRKQDGTLNPVSLRSSLLRGLGLVHFRWRKADAHARIKVQVKENVTLNNVVQATETLGEGGTAGWETIETIDFSDAPSGSRTVSIDRRYDGKEDGRDYYYGLVRLVIDEEVEAAALANGRPQTDPAYGQVEIVEMYVWDLPEYDEHSWVGWNFRAAGWVGDAPDAFANLTDGPHGLSGLLNNTLEPATLADREKSHYSAKPPHVQSPTFRTGGVGAVSFKARLYDVADLATARHPAVVTVYGANRLDDRDEPVESSWAPICDVLVTNDVYTAYTVKLKANDGYRAIRFGVRGVTDGGAPYRPPLRVALDDLCLWERLSTPIAFRGSRVRPFRDADAIRATTAVADIEDVSEQPLASESFGFQAEVVVLDDEEVLTGDPEHPITVDLWYYAPKPGETPDWGFDSWKDREGAVCVALKPAEGAANVFRSTVDVAKSLCPPQFLADGEPYRLVQYHVIAHFYYRNAEEGRHQQDSYELQKTEWTTPAWYQGFPDPNAEGPFSAYTLIDRLAPRRAWINEINYCEETTSSSLANQWIELAVPSGEDMTGWTLDLYDYEGTLVSTLGKFGERGWPTKKSYRGESEVAAKSHYAFYTVRSPYTTDDPSRYDAVWKAFNSQGSLEYNRPYALALTRPTGIVEHRVVVQGKNDAKGKYWYWARYEGTNLVSVMEEKYGGKWTWSAEDFKESPGSGVSVVTNQGALHAEWASPVKLTPGEINAGQYIDPDWLIRPNGGYVWVYSTVFGDHLRQVIGGVTNTAGSMTVSEGSCTNILFVADRWYQLDTCTVDPPERTRVVGPTQNPDGTRTWSLNLDYVSNRVDVTATSGISQEVRDFGLAPDHPYAPAVLRWLEKGVTGGSDGTPRAFKNPNGPLLPMYYRGGGETREELKFPDLYWLDVDPTDGNWELWGNMGEKGGTSALGRVDEPVVRTRTLADGSQLVHTNRQTTVWLELRNDAEGVSYPPYRLQGLGNEQSDTYSGAWTSANFKVTMRLMNGKVDEVFRPMRAFVFDRNSFRAKDDAVAPYAARIEIVDPFCDQSPAAEWGWQKYSDKPVSTRWALDERVNPSGVSTLKKDDLLEF